MNRRSGPKSVVIFWQVWVEDGPYNTVQQWSPGSAERVLDRRAGQSVGGGLVTIRRSIPLHAAVRLGTIYLNDISARGFRRHALSSRGARTSGCRCRSFPSELDLAPALDGVVPTKVRRLRPQGQTQSIDKRRTPSRAFLNHFDRCIFSCALWYIGS